MRIMRSGLIGAIGAFLLLVPSVSEAQWRWLDKLSGPGPFVGVQGEIKLFCSYEPGEQDQGEPRNLALLIPILSSPCVFPTKGERLPEKRNWAVGVATGLAASFANDLSYEGNPSTSERVVINVPLELFADVALRPLNKGLSRLELGGFVGTHLFFGASPLPFVDGTDVIPSTQKAVVGVRLSLRTFTLYGQKRTIGSVKVRSGVMFYPDGFTAEDFGAQPGWSERGRDPVFFITVAFDFDKW